MKYSEEFLVELKRKNKLIDIAKLYYKDIKEMSETQCQTNCKHGDTNASLTFYLDTETFYCFGCGAGSRDESYGSDVIGFVQWMEDITFHQAVKKLADRVGMEIPADNSSFSKEKKYVLNLNRQYWANLKGCSDAVAYFNKRGINEEQIAKWRLGCTNTTPIMVTIGIMNTQGDTVGFGYRFLYDKDRGPQDPKYKNSKQSDLFNKRKLLYGLNYAIPLIRRKKYAVLVEGFFDAIALQAVDVPAIADMGTSLTDEQIELLKDYTSNVILFFDGDGPGKDATLKTIEKLEEKKMDVKIINIHGKDPDEIAEQYKEETERFILDSAAKVNQYKLNVALNKYNAQLGDITRELLVKAIPIISETKDKAERIGYINEINKLLNADYSYFFVDFI
ncbi:MAG TPA: toprim domain-containing protein [Pseudoneobacillus sp.]|nr:toprim domain-containing protein [Pseudoneobacillus sp.]